MKETKDHDVLYYILEASERCAVKKEDRAPSFDEEDILYLLEICPNMIKGEDRLLAQNLRILHENKPLIKRGIGYGAGMNMGTEFLDLFL